VVRERRGLGVGFRLLGAVITQARREERVAVSLSVEAEDPARRLYRRFGFEPVGGVGGSPTLPTLLLLVVRPA
jgi:ribosomal protein S18 acetylase RimI-like enzyme